MSPSDREAESARATAKLALGNPRGGEHRCWIANGGGSGRLAGARAARRAFARHPTANAERDIEEKTQMKLNFWQWLGVLLLVAGLLLWWYERNQEAENPVPPGEVPPPTTQA